MTDTASAITLLLAKATEEFPCNLRRKHEHHLVASTTSEFPNTSGAGHINNDGGLGGATVAAITPRTSVTGHSNDEGFSGVANSATTAYTAARARHNNNSTFVGNVHGVPIIIPIIVADIQVQEFTMKTLFDAANRLNNMAPEKALAEIYRYNNLTPEQQIVEAPLLNKNKGWETNPNPM